MEEVQVYSGGKFTPSEAEVVAEFPLVLRVNDREIVTLIASPHDLRFLVAGFLRVQGFVKSVSDFEMFSVCNDYGIANQGGTPLRAETHPHLRMRHRHHLFPPRRG